MQSQRTLKELTAEDVGMVKSFSKDLKNYVAVTHAQFCPSGRQLAFSLGGFRGRGSSLRCGAGLRLESIILLEAQIISHYCWMSEFRILYWGRSKNGAGRYKVPSD